MSENKIVWHKYPQEKPKKDDEYLVPVKVGDEIFTSSTRWIDSIGIFRLMWDGRILAWAELPDPYKEDCDE